MKKKKTIQRILFLALWSVIICGMSVLLVAANGKKKEHICKEVLLGIKGSGEKYYIEKNDILQLIEKASGGVLQNRPVTSIDLAKLEKTLEQNSWIRDAELYFDSRDALHVYVEEREPVARVFSTNGNSFYIDSSGHKMSLVEKMSARVPVITGYVDVKKMNARDSAFLDEVKEVAQFIYQDDFWNAQTGQIVITPEKNFELIPVIGDHVIRLGNGHDVARKLGRLFVFYRQVISKVGFHKYAAIDLKFDGQVVAVKKGPASPVDSIQLQKNIEELMNRASLQDVDDNMLPEAFMHATPDKDTVVSKLNNTVPVKTDPNPSSLNNTNSNPAKTNLNPVRPKEKPTQPAAKPANPAKPKAVMKRV